jgi:SAM-dependent methyltransferase
VEPNPAFADFARTHADCAVRANLDDLEPGVGPFDLILLVHVLEHVKRPVALLRSLAGRLDEGGRLYVDVPDLAEYRGLEALHIAHLWHFSEDSLGRSIASAGLEPEAIARHAPVRHPRSLRALVRRGGEGLPAVPLPGARSSWAADWDRVRGIHASAHRYHRRRWPFWKRWAFRLETRRSREAAAS